MIPVQLIVAGLLTIVSATSTWYVTRAVYEKQIADIHTTNAMALAEATSKALAETNRLQEQVNASERKHQSRIADMQRSVAATAVIADGLRNDLATARAAMPDATCSSLRLHAATLNQVFGLCTSRLERMAEAATGHSIDALKLLESWPTSAKP